MIEVLPADELPDGLPAPAGPPGNRDELGRFSQGAAASEAGRRGAIAKQESQSLKRLMGLKEPPEDHWYRPYYKLSREWRDGHIAELAATVGGGRVGPGPASIVSTAALQLAAARHIFDTAMTAPGLTEAQRADLILKASRLGDSSRQNILAAHELTVREAEARAKQQPISPNDALLQSIQGE